jgi:hypothetical protein
MKRSRSTSERSSHHTREIGDAVLPIFLLAYWASIHDILGSTPTSLVFERELCLPYVLLFGAPPDKEQPKVIHAAYLVDHLHVIHNYVHQHLKLASDQMKTRYDKLANCAGYKVWLYRPTRTEGKWPNLQSSWEGPYNLVTGINDVVCRIQRNPRSRLMVVHLDWPVPY